MYNKLVVLENVPLQCLQTQFYGSLAIAWYNYAAETSKFQNK